MKTPYRSGPDYRFWKRAVSNRTALQVDPSLDLASPITPQDRIVTAGSCFAQHIGRYLKLAGFNFLLTEPGHPALSPMIQLELSYNMYSARYGNIYSARQLLQLFERAYGRFQPAEDVWIGADGALYDPFRPEIQEGGFPSAEVYHWERERHFAAVRRAFEGCDVFIFTLGLTEIWASRHDGAVFQMCPGVSAGEFDPERHVFHNLTADEVTADMGEFITRLRAVNPRVRVILTVSPVPLVATAEDEHVLSATTYSKAVLRVAAETLRRSLPDVHYFPSYEIITGPHGQGAFYGPDHRSILEAGVRQVMDSFFRHFTTHTPDWTSPEPEVRPAEDSREEAEAVAQVLCDEELLDQNR
jgi:hypothetical protein